jgi:uncharacterized protein (DUF58 family)
VGFFDDDFLRRLEALRLAARRRTGTSREGDRLTSKRGGAAVFHAYRPYVQGDDVRQIDWPLYARLGQLMVRECAREEALRLHLVVDGSASMRGAKFDFAKRLAAAIGLIAGGEGDEVVLWSGGPRTLSGDALLKAIETLPPSDVRGALRGLKTATRPLAVVIGDFWDDVRGDLAAVSGGQLSLIRVLSREELEPAVRGMARLTDSESGESVDRFLGDGELAEYRRLLAEDERGWREWARQREITFLRCAAEESLEQVLLVYLRGEGVLQ